MTKILLISNMFPCTKNAARGVFVEKVFRQLCQCDELEVHKCVLSQKRFKVVAYLAFYIRALIRIARLRKCVLYCHFVSRTGLLAMLGKHLFRHGLVVNCHGSDIVLPARHGGLIHQLNRIVLKSADKVIVPSSLFKKMVVSMFGIDDEFVSIYPSGGVFCPRVSDLRNPSESFRENVQFGFVGNLVEGKGLLVLVECFNRIDFECTLHIAGAGDCSLIAGIKNPRVNIIYHGVLLRTALNQLYSQLDMLLFPSVMKESLGLVLLEAMAFSVPVTASRVGAVPELVVHGENGFLIEPGDPQELLNIIEYFRSLSIDRIAVIRENARAIALKYDDQKIPNLLWSVFKELDVNG